MIEICILNILRTSIFFFTNLCILNQSFVNINTAKCTITFVIYADNIASILKPDVYSYCFYIITFYYRLSHITTHITS